MVLLAAMVNTIPYGFYDYLDCGRTSMGKVSNTGLESV